jgi:hypothetical protein
MKGYKRDSLCQPSNLLRRGDDATVKAEHRHIGKEAGGKHCDPSMTRHRGVSSVLELLSLENSQVYYVICTNF